jgi:cytochrome c oxidase cbb3-type subunit III
MRQSKLLIVASVLFGAVALIAPALAQDVGRGGGRGGGGRGAGGATGRVDIAQSRNMDQASIDRGGKLFATQCASCHGANARGGSKTKTTVDLIRSELVLDDLGTGGREIAGFLKYGRPEKNMPKFDLPDQDAYDIAAWLHRQIAAAAERGSYQRLNVFSGDPKAGEAFFNGSVGKCNTCHSATGDMKGLVARNSDDAPTIQGMIVSGGGRGGRGGGGRGAPAVAAGTPSPTAVTAKVTLKSGEVINGYPASIDDWQITIRLPSGELRSFLRDGDWPKYETHNPLQAHVDLQFKLTDDDIHNLAAYLRTLK